jgi:Raf kinase inhibitor-like YbhB/YbcL family protein
MTSLHLSSPDFASGERIPEQYGYRMQNVNPPLSVSGVLDGAETLALVVDDPDAVEPAGKVWDHWVVWNIDPETSEIPEGWTPTEASQGENSYGERGYGGPNPPDREHTYRFKLYALDTTLDLDAGATKADLEAAMEGHVLDETVLEGTYAP